MRYAIAILMLASFTANLVAADGIPKLQKYAGSIYFGKYDPPAPKSWNSIPEPARSRIIAHLKNRLGDSFYGKLTLVGGQMIDINELREKEPNSINYQWEVPAYCLHLRFSLPEKGIEFYDASISCRLDGSVIEEIDLPEIAKHPERAEFISTLEAFEIAGQNGFDTSKVSAKLDYRVDPGVCVYTFRQVIRKEDTLIFFKVVDIDAHNGKVVKIYDSEALGE
jgi:hypothetical protein